MTGSFRDRLQQQRAEREARGEVRDANAAQVAQERLDFFNPICHMIGEMSEAGVKFPAGRPPSRAHALNVAELSTTGPRIRISIDSRREMVLETTTRAGVLMYSAYLWEISQSSNQLVTADLSAVENWLAEQVAQFEYRPSRPNPRYDRRVRTSMPPPLVNPVSVPPEETAEADDGDEGSEGREQRVIDLR
jgi:hypothetical protein